jgi:hypothetical protein
MNFQRKQIPTITRNATPAGKIGQIAQKLDLPGLIKQQGTTVVKYDTLPLDGTTSFEFFSNSQNRGFPFSNNGSDGGKLGVGETMVIQRISLALVATTDGVITAITPLTTNTAGLIDGEITISTANNNVLLKLPVVQFLPQFNKNAENQLNTSYEFDTLLVIPPQVDFKVTMRVSGKTLADNYLRMTLEGVGTILNLKATL